MLVERAELQIKEGMEQAFAAAMTAKGLPLLKNVPGVGSVQFGRGVEHPQKFMLLVVWDAMESHAAFSKSAAILEFRSLIQPFATGGAMEHFDMN
jgi:heme-degrading monooxygenase HmoA